MKYRITFLLSILLLSSGLFATPYQNILDTALAANTTIYLSKTGQATVAVNPAQYNALTDSVFISKVNFDCGDINQNTSVYVQIFDTTTTPSIIRLNKTTIINPLDTSAPDVSLVSAHTLYLNQAGTALLTFASIDLGSWDSCGLNIIGFKVLTKTNYYCSDIGTAPITISVPDFHGNLTTAVVQITVLDTLPPSIHLKPLTLYLNGAGSTSTMQFADINNGTVDNCGLGSISINGASQLTFGCSDTGFVKVVAIVNDTQGNVDKDSINVYVVDTLNPSYTKMPFTAYLDADSVFVKRSNILSNLSGGCFPPVLSIISDTVFTCADIAANPRFITFSITNGSKTILDSVAVTVADTISPDLTLKTDTVYLAGGSATLNFANVHDSSSDNCGLDSATVNGFSTISYSCADTGSQNVVVVLYDVNGNSTTDSINVFVADTVTPTYIKTPFTASLISSTVSVSRSDILSNITGGCYSPSITFTSDTVFTCLDVTSNPHYITFVFNGGIVNIVDSVSVTVIDTVKPLIALKSDTLALVANNAILTFAQIDNGTYENCGLDSVSLNGFSSLTYTCSDTGMQKIVVFAMDVNGNSSTDSVNVYVADTIAPQYTKTPYTAYLTGDSAIVSRGDFLSNVVGGCFTPAVAITSDTIFYCLDLSVNPNYINFTIGSGVNMIADSIAITVADTLNPTLLLKTDTLYLTGATAAITFANVNNNSTDNCGLDSATINNQSQFSFTCSSLGLQKVGVVLYDVNGNFSADSVNVFVVDTIKPTLMLKSDTLILVNGVATLTFANINNASLDNCALDSAALNGFSTINYSCADTGVHSIAVVLYDVNGNSSNDSVNVYVADTLAPSYTTNAFTASLIGDSVAVSRASYMSQVTTGCFAPIITILSDTTFYCADVNSNPNVIHFSISSGAFNVLDSVAITVIDTLKPNLQLKADTLILVNNSAVLNFSAINDGSFDNCALDSVNLNGFSQLNYTCSDSGLHKIVVQLFDEHGNSSIDSVNIYVADTISPSYTKKPFIAYLTGDSVAVSRADILDSVAAGCFLPIITLLNDTVFSCADILTSPNYIQFSLSTGLTTLFDSVAVTVLDSMAPTLLLQSDTLVLQNGSATVTFSNVNQGSFDNCGLDSALVNGSSSISFTCATAGANRIGVMLYDIYGNVRSDSVTVHIQDSVPPSYTKTPYSATIVGTQTVVSRTDLLTNISGGCSQPFVKITSDTTFTCADILTNPNYVKFKISNGGPWITDSVAVYIIDVTPPTMSIKPPPILSLDVNGTRVLTYQDLLSAYPTDNCGIDSIYIVPPMLTCANTSGYAPIIVTAYDISGNYSTVSTFALATDITMPTIVTKSDTVYLDSISGQHTLVPSDVLASWYDGCGISSIVFSKTNYSCSDIGPNSVVVTATDFAGNIRIKTANFYLADSNSPSFNIVPSHSFYLDNAGQANVSFAALAVGTPYDDCGITDTILSTPIYYCSDIGLDTLTVSLKDASGNIRTKQTIISVLDTIKPIVVVQNISVQIDTTSGVAVITPWQLMASAYDNCSIDSNATYVSQSVFTCGQIGFNPVILSVTDVSGNTTFVSATVNVIAPQISKNIIVGSMQVCSNSYNIKYSIQDINPNSNYVWTFDPGKAKVISTSYKGREIYIHWIGTPGSSIIKVDELNLASCGTSITDTVVTISGSAPDTATIVYWNSLSKTTLVSTDTISSYFQWGYDVYVGTSLVSNTLVGETKNSYHNPNLVSNISNLGYMYWCEASFDGQCWNRSYFDNKYPISIPEELDAGRTLLWPNPVTDKLTISTTAKVISVQISDMFGKVVYKKQIEELQEITLDDLNNLPAAGYVLTIKYVGGSMSNHKIVRTK